ncbi:MAG TPA: sugar phosphate isomerase/epimerase family protein, partial [Planctomycetota bacterium]|nr:sugar phosphate isomerase/epimerase family protein [Planctomycetota bacterium]
MLDRRSFLAAAATLLPARGILASLLGSKAPGHLGLASFSCSLHWRAVGAGQPGTQFSDALSFFEYGRKLGADGVQTGLRSRDPEVARKLRAQVEKAGGTFEAEIGLPKTEGDLGGFEKEVELAREAGASVARGVLLGGRRYETFHSPDDFREFRARGERSLTLAEPVLRKHGLKLAVENHKDQTVPEMLEMLRKISSEWVGVCVDLGNNIALLEDPLEVVKGLAPLAQSVHLKDMAVEISPEGFLLSEVPLGTGFLDLGEMVRILRAANPAIVFNLEMATRDPLRVPCLTPGYWATFPGRPASDLAG